jgi:hypothetical protein
MLQDLSNEIRECYQRAGDCRRRAEETTDPATKRDFLEMEKRWLSLARSYDFADQISRFTNPFRNPKTGRPLDRQGR